MSEFRHCGPDRVVRTASRPRVLSAALLFLVAVPVAGQTSATKSAEQKSSRKTIAAARSTPKFELIVVRGKVVWLADALRQDYGIRVVKEARERTIAIRTNDGRLIPLVEDIRGRAFRNDRRLRRMDLELHVRRFKHASVAQIVHVFEWASGKKYEIDYWCEICSIPIFELKVCDCCQGPIELRRRQVTRRRGKPGSSKK